MKRVRIIGTGSYAPEKVLNNYDLEKFVDTTHEWISTRTGIRERHVAAEGEYTSDLAAKAAERALEMAGLTADQIDLIIVGTITGDYPWPATACVVQEKLKAVNAVAFDISAACSGFIFALATASSFITAGTAKRALVIGAEVFTRAVDWSDRNTCVLFGDGAGAVVVDGHEGEQGILSSHLHSDGSYVDLLYQPGFGSVNPASEAGIKERLPFLKMQGTEVFKIAVRSLSDVALEALAANQLSVADVDLFIPHQANQRILDACAKRIGFNPEQVFCNVERYGNTSGASIPLALDEANRAGRIKPGDLVLLDAFGGGFTWGAILLRW
jgi:3-oxoacyl-[acyl-carrier-protein] synthase-3